VKLLLEQGVEVNAKNHNGETALVVAAGMKHMEIMHTLLQYGGER
jgi:ankyrin repeat protein